MQQPTIGIALSEPNDMRVLFLMKTSRFADSLAGLRVGHAIASRTKAYVNLRSPLTEFREAPSLGFHCTRSVWSTGRPMAIHCRGLDGSGFPVRADGTAEIT